ncbi:MAG: hypothetical protein WB839_19045, partial [Pseudolabrys sp.]
LLRPTKCTEGLSIGNTKWLSTPQRAAADSARGDKAASGSLLPESVRWPVIVEGLAFDGDLHFVLRDLEQAYPNDER